MIKFFRKIRQKLLSENKFSKYVMYAIGEITLVVIGIIIALWLNNLNQNRIESQERSKLKTSLKEELLENKASFKKYEDFVNECHKKIIAVLEVSAGQNTEINMDSLRAYLIEMIPLNSLEINQSRINSAKASGKFGLLTSEESAAIAIYETALDNYKNADNFQKSYIEDYMPVLLKFSRVAYDHKQFFPDIVYPEHPQYTLSDQDLVSFLKTTETYEKLNFVLFDVMLDIVWLRKLGSDIDKTIDILNSKE